MTQKSDSAPKWRQRIKDRPVLFGSIGAAGLTGLVVVEASGDLTVVDPAEYGRVPLTVLASAAGIALAFALVVVATMRGFGFVRGTGQPGEMTPDEVRESHGFYWRH